MQDLADNNDLVIQEADRDFNDEANRSINRN